MRGQEQEQVNGEKGEIAVVATILYDWLKEVSRLQPHLGPLRSFRLGNSFHLRPSPSASIICLAFALLFGRYTFALLLRSLLSLELHADIHRGVDVMGNVTSDSAQPIFSSSCNQRFSSPSPLSCACICMSRSCARVVGGTGC